MPLHLAPGLLLHQKPHINNSQGPSSRARVRGLFFSGSLLILYVTAACLIFLISAPQSRALFCLLAVFAESLPCELLWLRLYLDGFLPTRFQGWLLNKKMK